MWHWLVGTYGVFPGLFPQLEGLLQPDEAPPTAKQACSARGNFRLGLINGIGKPHQPEGSQAEAAAALDDSEL